MPSNDVAALEADIAAARTRLAGTIDQLAVQATPQAIAKRQVERLQARFTAATTTPEGDLRVERVAAVAAAAAVVVAFLVWRRRRR